MKKIFLAIFLTMFFMTILLSLKEVNAICCEDPATSQCKCWGSGYCCRFSDGTDCASTCDGACYWSSSPCAQYCDGTDISCGTWPNCENCNALDDTYCTLNWEGREHRDYSCTNNAAGCDYSASPIGDCGTEEDVCCNSGKGTQYHNYYCTAPSGDGPGATCEDEFQTCNNCLGTFDECSCSGGSCVSCDPGESCVDNACVIDAPPSCSVTSILESSSYAYKSGATVWYNTAGTGSFTVNVNANDDYGVSRVYFPDTVSTGGNDFSSPYSWAYNWNTGDTYSSTTSATAYDTASQTGTCQFTVKRDVTASTTSASIDGSYTITLNRYDNAGGSGVYRTYYCTDTSNSCNPTTTYSSPFDEPCSDCCYVRYYSIDQVDNQESTKSTSFGPLCGCVRTGPSVSLSPDSQSGLPSTILFYTATITNNDNPNCGSSTFGLTKSCPSGWSCSLNPTSRTISPGSSADSAFSVGSSPLASPGDYTISVTATNNGAPSYIGSDSAIYTVTTVTTTSTTTPTTTTTLPTTTTTTTTTPGPTCGSTDTSCGTWPNCENCNALDDTYCTLNWEGREHRDYSCTNNAAGCDYSASPIGDCGTEEDVCCNSGKGTQYHNYYCTAPSGDGPGATCEDEFQTCNNCPSTFGECYCSGGSCVSCEAGETCVDNECVISPTTSTTSPGCGCSGWVNQPNGCGAGGCLPTQMWQTRSCDPVGCADESQCAGPDFGVPEDQGCGVSCGTAGMCNANEQCQKREVIDTYGCAEDDYQCVPGPSCKAASFEIYRGWNLISSPVADIDSVSEDTCGAENGNFYFYNITTGKWVVDTVGVINLKKGIGYWFYSEARCSITVSGSGDVMSNDISIQAGWNQIGIPAEGMSSYDIEKLEKHCKDCGPEGTEGVCSSMKILWYNPLAQEWVDVSTAGPGNILESGKGYHVQCVK